MNTVVASSGMNSGGAAGIIGSLIPLVLMGLIFGFVLMSIAKRKGRNKLLWFAAGYVPLFNLLGGVWLSSLPDIALIEKINSISKELQKLNLSLTNKLTSHSSQAEDKWTCTCGRVNSIDVINCPDCGIKRDYLLKKKS